MAQQSDLVSVVMCFLNGAAWIGEAIESVLGQDHPHRELILVDDGSTDGASQIAEQYAARYKTQIRYVGHAGHINRGLTISRNTGIAAANGDFVAFLDADDRWLPEKLTSDLRLFLQYPAAAMICQASVFWYSWEEPSKADVYTAVGAEPDRLYPPMSLCEKLYPLGKGAPPCPSGIIIRKDALVRNGGFEEAFHGIFGLYEDQAFLAKIYLHEHVFIAGKANNLYRKHAGSMTDSLNDEALYGKVRLFFLDWFGSYLDRHPDIPPRVKQRVVAAGCETERRAGSLVSRE